MKRDTTFAGIVSAPTEGEARKRVIAGFVESEQLIPTPVAAARKNRKEPSKPRLKVLEEKVGRLEELLERAVNAMNGIASRQCQMRAELLDAGAFEKRSSLVAPTDAELRKLNS